MAQGWPDYPCVGASNGKPDGGSAAVFCGNQANPTPSKVPGKRLRLETGAQVRREVVKVYRDMKAGTLDVTRASKLIYALTELSRMIERETVERLTERLEAVERGR